MRNKLFEAIKPLQLNTNDKNKLVNTIIDIGNSGGSGGVEYEYYKLDINKLILDDFEENINKLMELMEILGAFVDYAITPLREYSGSNYVCYEIRIDNYKGISYRNKTPICFYFKAIKQNTRNFVTFGYHENDREVLYSNTYYSNKNSSLEQFIDLYCQANDEPNSYETILECANNFFISTTKEEYESSIGTEYNM